ncbi:hypothetical protein XI07_15790 [Bradyrhizobium sp. CCBAU 11445]|uniref:hypothetical protein n=1 Tax=unclassified Bradyrhizobium TaxID=2631580 RepID=UPI0023068EDD|nr:MULTISPECIES: hypothetical protein [unclassified Bradyrhizobium]MDA9483446.1 hypothetical protein [Bradyrhizobium sp. CCBAU 11445]MDA9523319.1 hypothetical protein [Bradyrhizobium sp. CCBAU 11434]
MTVPMFSKTQGAQFGSFHYPLGMIEFTMSDQAQQAVKQISAGKLLTAENGDNEALTQVAYEVASLFHEMRHLVDMFGTMAGCTLFSYYIEQLKTFAEISDAMRQAGMHWKFPLGKWRSEKDCPQVLRDFLRETSGLHQAVDVFISPFKPVEVEDHHEDILIELGYEGGGLVDAFPLRIGRFSAEKKTARSILFPIGLEALTEASAHAISRNIVGHYFPESVAQRLEGRVFALWTTGDPAKDQQLAAEAATPYMAIDLLITRFLQQYQIYEFPRDLVLALVDRVLSESAIKLTRVGPGVTGIEVDRLGTKLVNVLKSENFETLRTGVLSERPEIDIVYQGLVTAFENEGKWETVADDRSLLSSVKIWESYVAHKLILPLLRQRVATKGRAFRRQHDFFSLLQRIGVAPARVVHGKLILSDMPERVQQAWIHQMMLGQILHQFISDKPIYCPRAFSTLPGIASLNLALEGNCERFIRRGCGTFRMGQEKVTTPNCLFEQLLGVTALRRH